MTTEHLESASICLVFPMTYPRGITVQPGHPNVIFLTIGEATRDAPAR